MMEKPKKGEIFPSFEPRELKAIVKEHASAYNTDDEKETPRVEFTDRTSHWNHEDGVIRVNPVTQWEVKEASGLGELDALRLLLDTLSHEVEHVKQSPPGSMKDFAEEFPEYPRTASAVLNIIEDCYIDHQRIKEFEGLKRPFNIATKVKLGEIFEGAMDSDDRVQQMLMVIQLTMRGEITWPDELEIHDMFIKTFQKEIEEVAKDVPKLHDFEERKEVAEEVASTVLNYAPDDFEEKDHEDKLDDLLDELLEELAEEIEEEFEELPDDMKKKMKEDMEDMIEEESSDLGADPSDSSDSDEDKVIDIRSGDEEGEETKEEETGEAPGEEEEESEESEEESTGSVDVDTEPEDLEKAEGDSEGTEATGDDRKILKKDKQEFGDKPTGGESGDVIVQPDQEADPIDIPDWVEEGVEFEFEEEDQKVADLSEDVESILEQLRPEETEREVNSTKGSELDVRKAVRHKAGDPTERKVFKRTKTEQEDRTIGVTIDCSGSMTGRAIKEGRAAIGALGKATKAVGDNLAVNTFFTAGEPDPETKEISSAEEEFSQEDVKEIKVHHLDPMALGITKAEEQIEDRGGEKVIFALGDGDPTITSDGERDESKAEEEVAEEVRRIRNQEDFEVIGIGVGESPNERAFDKMFGEDGWFRFSEDELAEKLLTVYRNKVRN